MRVVDGETDPARGQAKVLEPDLALVRADVEGLAQA